MPKRNIVWITTVAVIAILLWKVPENLVRRDTLYNQFGPLLDVRVQICKHYVEEVKDEKLLRGAIEGMLSRLDRYSEYYDQQEYEQFDKKTRGRFPGIGILVDQVPGEGLLVVSPIEGSPAFGADLRTGDRILRIDGQETRDLTVAQGVKLIEGPPGTRVVLTIYRPSSDETLEKSITRDIVVVRTIRGWARSPDWQWDYLLDPKERIAYVRISSFEGQTAGQFDVLMQQELLARQRIRGLILDVRDNPGGLLESVVEIADKFITQGRLVSTKGRLSPEKPFMATRENTYPDIPLAVLINRGSASASEILAGVVQDHKRGKVVGERSFGKGSVQELIPIENNTGAVKITTAYYYLPNGERIHGKGIVPDEIVDLTPDERDEMVRSYLAVYSTAHQTRPSTTTTQATATTSTAPAEGNGRVAIVVDRQMREALRIVREAIRSAK